MLQPGVLTLAATPIGNPLDASVRLQRALAAADLIAAEDTRRLARLARDLEVELRAKIISYHEHNEAERTELLLAALREGRRVLVVTDAGMPVVSDPGFQAVRAAVETGLPITVIPGPSAVLTALAASGIAPDRFTFEGFPPRREGRLRSLLESLAQEPRTMVFFESPRRTAATLAAMAEVLGEERPAAVARELTKTHEEVVRGSLAELAAWADEHEVLGEIVLVISGAQPTTARPEDLVDAVLQRAATGERLKDAAKEAARGHGGISARELYDLSLRRRAADGS
ncbi:16S rRNA (cytidine(1402)-2'-O)-methyltransferase [Brachybacterium sp. Marseille-Q7125]|uniref:16S rRNA (cytidine(1402)-2'-O)-methyltransferase n=1 Tax=Brachybacterium sp. Marseille-Q7125 TaxID=2932815 RepID=UPI001FF29EF8|nr:16S rRNA (cytidine(1402)-2'-O)-methyltransferase [Brachybacterium sp. Marseille-Q7125]